MSDLEAKFMQGITITEEDGSTIDGWISDSVVILPSSKPIIRTQAGKLVWMIYHLYGNTISEDASGYGYFEEDQFFVELADDAVITIGGE